jgi:sulfur carrier protein
MPEVYINQKPLVVRENATLGYVLESSGIHAAKGIAVAVNNIIIPKAKWSTSILLENDKITIIKATQGG